jgi:CheY-like chemotaxis protein
LTTDHGKLSGLRVFVAEDHYAIAAALVLTLERFGCRVVAQASSAARARSLAEDVEADCALLDLNLGDGYCYDAAQRLQVRGIPVVFLSGYREALNLPPPLKTTPHLLKPVDAEAIRRVLLDLV